MIANPQIIAREALKELLKNGQDPTPEAYQVAYNKEAEKLGAKPSGYSIDKILDLLDKDARDTLFSKPFKSKDDLLVFLAKTFNQMFFYRKNFALQRDLIKIFLRLLSTHPTKEISNLAKSLLLEIDNITQVRMQVLRDKWMEIVKKTSAEDTSRAKSLEIFLNLNIQDKDFIAWKNRLNLTILDGKLDIFAQNKFLKEFEEIFNKKINNPPNEAKKEPLNTISTKVQEKETFDEADILKTDSTTTLLTKESIHQVLNFAEKEFLQAQKNYSIVVFGIASYEKLVDNFGTEATHRVVATLGRLLKRYSNPSDLIAYYSEQEFLACLLDREEAQAIAFIKEIDKAVKESIFMYKEIRININLSAQVSHRIGQSNLESMLKTTLENFTKNKDSSGILYGV